MMSSVGNLQLYVRRSQLFLRRDAAKRSLLSVSCIGVFSRCSKRPANFQQCIQNTRTNAGRLLDRVNTL